MNADRALVDFMATAICRVVQSIEDMDMRPPCWENLVFVGNGARLRGLRDNILQTLQARHLVSPSTATMFTSELPSHLGTPSGAGAQTPTGSFTGQQLHTHRNFDIFETSSLPLPWNLLNGRDFITLRDIVQHYKPENEPAILKLLDEWEKVHGSVGPRPPPSGLKNAATPSIKVLHDMRGQTGAKRNMPTTKDATRSLNFWRAPRMMVLAPPSSRHILKPATVERRQIPPGEARRSMAPTVFLKRFVEVITHPMLPWLLVGKQTPLELDSSMH